MEAESLRLQADALMTLAAEDDDYDSKWTQHEADRRAASLTRRQMAEMEAAARQAATIEAIAREAAAVKERAEREAADQAADAKRQEAAKAEIARGVASWEQQVAEQRAKRAQYLRDRDDRVAEAKAAKAAEAEEMEEEAYEKAKAEAEQERLAEEELRRDRDEAFADLPAEVDDTDLDDTLIPPPEVDENGLPDYEDEEREGARLEQNARHEAEAARAEAARLDAQDKEAEAARVEAARLDAEDQEAQAARAEGARLDALDEEAEMQRIRKSLLDAVNGPEDDEMIDDGGEDDLEDYDDLDNEEIPDYESEVDDDLLDDMEVEEEDPAARERRRSDAQAALLRAAEEVSEMDTAETRPEEVAGTQAANSADQDRIAKEKAAKKKKDFDEWMASSEDVRDGAGKAKKVSPVLASMVTMWSMELITAFTAISLFSTTDFSAAFSLLSSRAEKAEQPASIETQDSASSEAEAAASFEPEVCSAGFFGASSTPLLQSSTEDGHSEVATQRRTDSGTT